MAKRVLCVGRYGPVSGRRIAVRPATKTYLIRRPSDGREGVWAQGGIYVPR